MPILLMRILPQGLDMLQNCNIFLLLVTALPVFTMFYLSRQCKMRHIFNFLTEYWNFLEKIKFSNFMYLLGLDPDPDWPDLTQHALDARPDLAKWCGFDPIRIQIHNTDIFIPVLD
jgi:hypothetical protein